MTEVKKPDLSGTVTVSRLNGNVNDDKDKSWKSALVLPPKDNRVKTAVRFYFFEN